MMDIHIRVEKKHLYFFAIVAGVLLGVLIAYAYNPAPGPGTGNPAVFGHSVDEMDWSRTIYSNVSIANSLLVNGQTFIYPKSSTLTYLGDVLEADGKQDIMMSAGGKAITYFQMTGNVVDVYNHTVLGYQRADGYGFGPSGVLFRDSWGIVESDGTVSHAGSSGWASSQSATTLQYRIVFTTPFLSTPTISVIPEALASNTIYAMLTEVTSGGFNVSIKSTLGGPVSSKFHFIARGPVSA